LSADILDAPFSLRFFTVRLLLFFLRRTLPPFKGTGGSSASNGAAFIAKDILLLKIKIIKSSDNGVVL
jgi:hypothetical protein